MASSLAPIIQTYKAHGAIAKGKAVIMYAADPTMVAVAAATTDKSIGIAQNAVADGEYCEVALPGGGAKAAAQTTITAGKALVSHTDGLLKPIAQANDRVIAIAKQDAVVGDIFEVQVVIFQATATES